MTPCETRSVVSTGGDYSVFGARKMHAMRGRPEIAERHGAGHVARCTARAAHARHGSARHPPRQVTAHHPVRAAGAVPGRPGEPSLRRFQAERAVGVGHHICAYFQRLGVRGLRDGRLLPAGHRPADLHEPVRGPGRRRPGNGRLGAPARGRGPDRPGSTTPTAGRGTGPSAAGRPWPSARRSHPSGRRGTPFGFALAEALNSLYKAELIRNKGPWEGIDDVRARHRPVGPLVQHGAPPLRHRHAHPGRARGRPGPRHRPPGTTTTGHHRNQLTEPPQNPGLDKEPLPWTCTDISNPHYPRTRSTLTPTPRHPTTKNRG